MKREGFVDRPDGASIAFTWYNPQGGTPICFCPGLGGTQLGFEADADYFAATGRSALSFDLRGLGKSIPPKVAEPAAFTLERMAADVAALIRHCDVSAVDLVGNSMGGVIGLELIRQEPELLRSLTTFGTTYHLDLPRIAAVVQNQFLRLVGKRRLPSFVSKRSTSRHDAREVIERMFASFPFNVGRCMRMNIYKYDYREVAVQWGKPILLIKGGRDQAINRHLDTTMASLKNCAHFRCACLPDAGHFTNLDDPPGVRSLVSVFLEEHFPTRRGAGMS